MDDMQYSLFENRQTKIEDAITKLTEISSDLNKMIAVHELRITQQEKIMDSLEDVLERRREEADSKLRIVYETMRAEDRIVIAEIAKLREEGEEQFEQLSKKISSMEKLMFSYMGGVAILGFLIAYGHKILEVILKI